MGMPVHAPTKKFISLCICGRHKHCRKEDKPETYGGQIEEHVDHEELSPLLNKVYFGMRTTRMQTDKRIVEENRKLFESLLSAGPAQPLPDQTPLRGPTTWKDTQRNASKKNCELANNKIEHLYKVSTPCLGDYQFKEEELRTVGEMPDACSQIVLE